MKPRDLFTTIRTEGGLLPADLLQRLVNRDKDMSGLDDASYHLVAGERLNERISQSWKRLLGAWSAFRSAAEALPERDVGTTLTRERWLLILLQELEYGRLPAARTIEIDGKNYAISHFWHHSPIHLVSYRLDLDRRTAGVAGAARTSPHSLVQEFLNRSDDHLWGFVSNGLRLRILRDNISLTRQAFVEFDLEGMMEGEVYADFVLLWLLCHQSRVEAEKPEECWLERWARTAQEQGIRALDRLRQGVEQAIKTLGYGFLAHPTNRELRDHLRTGKLSTQDYYRQLLRLVYRLLFLFVAEDRDLLCYPDADPSARERYLRFYSTARLRRLAERQRGTKHGDLYHALRLVMERLGNDDGCPPLALPALGSFLWSGAALPDLMRCDLANRDLLETIRALAFTLDDRLLRPVDYKNLGTEELGSVYESLLELHPELNVDAATFDLATASGHERKTTGSYYTPASLVQCLLDSALEPVLDEAARQSNAEEAILSLKVCDPATGSGHFLIAAAHRIARRLAAIRTGEAEPPPEATRAALRDVISHCIYGVDINPMAVELCKVNLWLEALEPGKPLAFLEHRIQCGNSLFGTTPALLAGGIPDDAFKPIEGDDRTVASALRRRNKVEREGQMTLTAIAEAAAPYGSLTDTVTSLDTIDDTAIAGIHEKEARYARLASSPTYRQVQLVADAWCAAFVWKKTKNAPEPVTHDVFCRLLAEPERVPVATWEEIARLAEQYHFFHWHLAFPAMFRVPEDGEAPENAQTGWSGGFDVVLGNPPWEKLQTEELQFFAARNPEIASLKGAKRKSAIKALQETDPVLAAEWNEQRRIDAATIGFIRNSEIYPLTGVGKFNTFALFAELNNRLISPTSRVGCIVPSGIATDDTTKFFFQDIVTSNSLVSLFDFENRERLFPAVDSRMKFCLLTLTGKDRTAKQGAEFVFFAHSVEALRDEQRRFILSSSDIKLLNPNTLTCPTFRSQHDATIAQAIYKRVPVFLSKSKPQQNGYQAQVWRLLNTTDDSEDFVGFSWGHKGELVPVIEAKMIHQFDHRFATFPTDSDSAVEIPYEAKVSPDLESRARYYVTDRLFRRRMPEALQEKRWFLTARNITNATNERTVIAAIIPRRLSENYVNSPLITS